MFYPVSIAACQGKLIVPTNRAVQSQALFVIGKRVFRIESKEPHD